MVPFVSLVPANTRLDLLDDMYFCWYVNWKQKETFRGVSLFGPRKRIVKSSVRVNVYCINRSEKKAEAKKSQG